MSGRIRYRNAVRHTDKRTEKVQNFIPGILGFTIKGKDVVEVDPRPGYVYVRIRDNFSEVVMAFNSVVAPVYGLPVLLIRDDKDKNKYQIYGRDTARYASWGTTSAYLPKHGDTHSFDPYTPGGDPVWVWGRQLMPLAAVPSGTSGGPNVIIEEGTYWQNNAWHFAGATGTANITTYNPTGSTSRMVLVYLDGSGNPQLEAGSSFFTSSSTGTSQILPYLPAVPDTNAIPIAGIRLESGTSTILWGNIYDVRPWIVGSGYTPTGTVGVTDHGALTGLLDNDHPQYLLTGTAVDHGGLTGLLDNDHPQYMLTGSAAGHVIEDDGVAQTQRSSLNFVGGGFVVYDSDSKTNVSGTATIGPSGPVGASGDNTLLIYDDSVFKVTGTAISFDANLSVATTGSVAFVAGNAGGSGNETFTNTFANRPSGTVDNGDVFFPNDSFYIERVTGSSSIYQAWGPVFPLVIPPPGGWGWDNQQSATISIVNGGLTLSTPAYGSTAVIARYRTAPTPPYKIDTFIIPLLLFTNYHGCGILFRESASGKICTLRIACSGNFGVYSDKWTNSTTYSDAYISAFNAGMSPNPMFLRIEDNNINRICSFSFDGVNYYAFHTVGRTDFMTADQVGFFVCPINVTYGVTLNLLSWKES